MGWFGSNAKISDVAKQLPHETLKRLARIVVVDDEADSFPVDALRAQGYSIEYWPILDAERLSRLERAEFDIVVLDIQGVVPPGFSDTGNGLGVLRRIKKLNDSQVVVACSGQSYTIDTMEFYRLADSTLAKPISVLRAMETIDDLLRKHVDPTLYWAGIVKMLQANGVTDDKIATLENTVANAAKKNRRVSIDQIESIVGRVNTLATVGELVMKVVDFASKAP